MVSSDGKNEYPFKEMLSVEENEIISTSTKGNTIITDPNIKIKEIIKFQPGFI